MTWNNNDKKYLLKYKTGRSRRCHSVFEKFAHRQLLILKQRQTQHVTAFQFRKPTTNVFIRKRLYIKAIVVYFNSHLYYFPTATFRSISVISPDGLYFGGVEEVGNGDNNCACTSCPIWKTGNRKQLEIWIAKRCLKRKLWKIYRQTSRTKKKKYITHSNCFFFLALQINTRLPRYSRRLQYTILLFINFFLNFFSNGIQIVVNAFTKSIKYNVTANLYRPPPNRKQTKKYINIDKCLIRFSFYGIIIIF